MDKGKLRRSVRSSGAIDPGEGLLVVSGLFVWLSKQLPGTISAFLAMPDEVDPSPLFERLPGWRWVLPRLERDNSLTFRDRDVGRERHPFGMEQPKEKGEVIPIHEIDVFLTPGLAFDDSGGRLGQGGGYYDDVLARRRSDSRAVGVTIEERVMGRVPMSERDQRVDFLATERGVRECLPSN